MSNLFSDVSINNAAIRVDGLVSIFEERLEKYTQDLRDDECTYFNELNEIEEEKYIALLKELTEYNMDEEYEYIDRIYCKGDCYGLYENLEYDYLYVLSDDVEDEENEKYKGLAEAVSNYNYACNADVFLDLSDKEVWTITYAGCSESTSTTYHSDDIIKLLIYYINQYFYLMIN